jgi:methyl coenzyme M reductase beta subunit
MRMEHARDAAAWLVPALAGTVAAGTLVRIGAGREAAELATFATWLCVTAAVLGSLPAWLGRGR